MPDLLSLTLPEELLLLSLDDDTGGTRSRDRGKVAAFLPPLGRALIGAGLFELYLRNRLVFLTPLEMDAAIFEAKALLSALTPEQGAYLRAADVSRYPACRFADLSATGDAFLDAMLSAIRHDRRSSNRLPPAWFGEMIRTRLPTPAQIRDLAAQRLLQQGVLYLSERKAGGTIHFLLPTEKHEPERALVARLRDTVLNRTATPDERTVALLALVRACSLLETVFERAELDKAEWRIAQMAKTTSAPHTPLSSVLRYVVETPPVGLD